MYWQQQQHPHRAHFSLAVDGVMMVARYRSVAVTLVRPSTDCRLDAVRTTADTCCLANWLNYPLETERLFETLPMRNYTFRAEYQMRCDNFMLDTPKTTTETQSVHTAHDTYRYMSCLVRNYFAGGYGLGLYLFLFFWWSHITVGRLDRTHRCAKSPHQRAIKLESSNVLNFSSKWTFNPIPRTLCPLKSSPEVIHFFTGKPMTTHNQLQQRTLNRFLYNKREPTASPQAISVTECLLRFGHNGHVALAFENRFFLANPSPNWNSNILFCARFFVISFSTFDSFSFYFDLLSQFQLEWDFE